ncbi:MAG TPA: lantibiotic dehydratase, partial [Pyrinomonadaceae bacterium]
MPSHLIPLPGGPWTLWRTAGLRGAGFPASLVLELAAPECGRLADELTEAEEAYGAARQAAIDAVSAAIDERWRGGRAGDADQPDPLVKTMRALKKGRVPDAPPAPYAGDSTLGAFAAAAARYQAVRADFLKAFEAALAEISPKIFAIGRSEKFREAVIWQNRRAYGTGIAPLLDRPPAAGARPYKVRHAEELIASYLQRYCVKNDTVGFFGPVGWAELVPAGDALSARPGPSLLSRHNLYVEVWCVEELAKALSRDKELRPWIAPRRMPFVRVEGTELHVSFKGSLKVTPEQAAVILACDGEKLAREIASEVVNRPGSRVRSEADVYHLLETMHNRGVIVWALEAAMEMRPEELLRRQLERVGDEPVRSRALGAWTELMDARDAVARAAGDPAALDQALDRMEETFTRLTGATSTRAAGKTYAARTLLYEDCRRDLEVKIGPEVLRALGPPLSLLLKSAQWFTHQTASAYRKAFGQLHAELARASGSRAVDFVNLWTVAQSRLFGGEQRPVDALIRELQQRWGAILNVPWGERRVEYSAEELRPRVEAAFPAAGPGWSFARYHSPDLMIAAAGEEAFRRGEFQLILGEVHVGGNSLGWPVFLSQHPAPEELLRAVDLDLPEPRLCPIISKSQQVQSARLLPALINEKDYRLKLAPEPTSAPLSRILLVGDLVVENTDAGLVARTRDGSKRFDIVEAVADALMGLVINRFKILTPQRHIPRISIDRLVINRETWNFTAPELTFASEKDEGERFVGARRWARAHGMPRFVFVKSSAEVKPFYVDFDSPAYVNIFARTVRPDSDGGGDARITVTEMLPEHSQAWLPDAEGNRYTCELR